MQIPVHRLLMQKGEDFELSVLAGEKGLSNLICQPELHRPGLAFAGFLDIFTYDRLQVLGNTEIRYLASLSDAERAERVAAACQFPIPCFIVTTNNEIPRELISTCNTRNIPLLRTAHPTSRFNAMMGFWLEREFAPTSSEHGVLVDVFGVGVLIMGGSGIGKSECGLELIERGHRLVADDIVVVKRLGRDILMGASNARIQHHMEVRGLGIINVEMLFGIGSVREEKRISLVVELARWTEDLEIDRLGLDSQTATILDVPIRKFKIPVDSGRNISILVEIAALQHRVLERGINPAESLNQRLIVQMTRGSTSDTHPMF
jgi:HPr kinase/phosphorylase